MSNIVQRLRDCENSLYYAEAVREMAREAADEIERMRSAVVARDHVRDDPSQAPYVVKRLRERADDPMWADHAEVRKELLHAAANQILGMFAVLQNRGLQ